MTPAPVLDAWGIMRGMTNPNIRPAAFLLLSLFGALLLASCHHVDPKTWVMGPVTCGPEPGKKPKPKCQTCFETSCCAEWQACAVTAPCPCWFGGRIQFMRTEGRELLCGPQNDAYKALAACLDEHCAACPSEDGHHPLLGSPAPEIVATPVLADGLVGEGPKSLKEALGKVVIVDFWATWCRPCKQAFPSYQEIVDRYHGEVAVLAVSVDDPESVKVGKLVDFAKDTHVRFPIFWDSKRRTQASYRHQGALPTSYLVDRTGVVRFLHPGYGASERPRMAAEIEALVAEGKTPSGDAAPSLRRTPP